MMIKYIKINPTINFRRDSIEKLLASLYPQFKTTADAKRAKGVFINYGPPDLSLANKISLEILVGLLMYEIVKLLTQ